MALAETIKNLCLIDTGHGNCSMIVCVQYPLFHVPAKRYKREFQEQFEYLK